jgi:gamma-glutamylcyclotransferase
LLYFAYGSNLDQEQMQARCARARVDCRAVLLNHALAFGGFSQVWDGAVANVVRRRGARVEGLLYHLADEDLQALDRCEGHPNRSERSFKYVVDEQGRRRRAQVYLRPSRSFQACPPPPGYLALLRRAYDELGFDTVALGVAAGITLRSAEAVVERMRVVMRDEHVFDGTALQIVRAMQHRAFAGQHLPVSKYIEWVVKKTLEAEGVELHAKGETDDELARTFVEELFRTGLTHRTH